MHMQARIKVCHYTALTLCSGEPNAILCGNLRQRIPGRKTDQSDSEWLAFLLRDEQIKSSYVPAKHLRELREQTRLR
jgi:hypothetical protein